MSRFSQGPLFPYWPFFLSFAICISVLLLGLSSVRNFEADKKVFPQTDKGKGTASQEGKWPETKVNPLQHGKKSMPVWEWKGPLLTYVREYWSNEIAFQKKFEGKWCQVEGPVFWVRQPGILIWFDCSQDFHFLQDRGFDQFPCFLHDPNEFLDVQSNMGIEDKGFTMVTVLGRLEMTHDGFALRDCRRVKEKKKI